MFDDISAVRVYLSTQQHHAALDVERDYVAGDIGIHQSEFDGQSSVNNTEFSSVWFYLNGTHPSRAGLAIIPDSHAPDWSPPRRSVSPGTCRSTG